MYLLKTFWKLFAKIIFKNIKWNIRYVLKVLTSYNSILIIKYWCHIQCKKHHKTNANAFTSDFTHLCVEFVSILKLCAYCHWLSYKRWFPVYKCVCIMCVNVCVHTCVPVCWLSRISSERTLVSFGCPQLKERQHNHWGVSDTHTLFR